MRMKLRSARRMLIAAGLSLTVLMAACKPVQSPSETMPEETANSLETASDAAGDMDENGRDPGPAHPVQAAGGLPIRLNDPHLPTPTPTPPPKDYNNNGRTDGEDMAIGARKDIDTVERYDPIYVNTNEGYPDPSFGVCTDTVWRAFAEAGYDLKAMVDRDIAASPSSYPRIERPDPHIDFRRVPNLAIFFRRYATALTIKQEDPDDWQPGDIVIYGEDQYHIGIVSDRMDEEGFPLLLHHPPEAPKEMPIFEFGWVTGHYRWDANEIPEEILIPYEREDETPEDPALSLFIFN